MSRVTNPLGPVALRYLVAILRGSTVPVGRHGTKALLAQGLAHSDDEGHLMLTDKGEDRAKAWLGRGDAEGNQ